MTASQDPPSGFRILFVCTGNVCRSPFAEILTRHLLDEQFDPTDASRFVVSSAGTHGMAGSGMNPLSRAELAPWHLTKVADSFTARRLDAATASEADIVLTADRKHRWHVVNLQPSALAKTFCLRELTRLMADSHVATPLEDPVAQAHAVVSAARQQRGISPYTSTEDDAIPDPINEHVGIHHVMAEMITAAALDFVAILSSTRQSPATISEHATHRNVTTRPENGAKW